MQIIEVLGRASSKSWKLFPSESDLSKTLLDYLREQDFAVASSCSGQMKCRKCVFNEDMLACERLVKSFIGKQVFFDYM